jgi:hypothetical protein
MKHLDDKFEIKKLKSYKLIIHNCTSINMLKVLKNQAIEHRVQPLIIEYDKIKITNFSNYWFNAFEISDSCPLLLKSLSSFIMICIHFDDKSYTKMAKKIIHTLLYYLYNVHYLLQIKRILLTILLI